MTQSATSVCFCLPSVLCRNARCSCVSLSLSRRGHTRHSAPRVGSFPCAKRSGDISGCPVASLNPDTIYLEAVASPMGYWRSPLTLSPLDASPEQQIPRFPTNATSLQIGYSYNLHSLWVRLFPEELTNFRPILPFTSLKEVIKLSSTMMQYKG